MNDHPAHPSDDPTTDPLSTNHRNRCLHYTASGRRCRLPRLDAGSRLCFRHTQLHARQPDPGDLRSALAGELTEFKSAADINTFLSRLLLLVAQNRIAANRAAVLAGICSLLLRSLSAIDREASDELRPIMFGPPNTDPDESLQPS